VSAKMEIISKRSDTCQFTSTIASVLAQSRCIIWWNCATDMIIMASLIFIHIS